MKTMHKNTKMQPMQQTNANETNYATNAGQRGGTKADGRTGRRAGGRILRKGIGIVNNISYMKIAFH